MSDSAGKVKKPLYKKWWFWVLIVLAFGMVEGIVNPIKEKPADKVISGYDGDIWQVDDYLKETLKDPDSLKIDKWGTLAKGKDGYQVFVRYRAKNSFGGYVINDSVFKLSLDGKQVSETIIGHE